MPSSDNINSAFGDQWGLLFTVRFGTDSGCGTIRTGTAFLFPFLLLYGLGLVLSQVESVLETVFKKLQSRREALSFTKSITVLLQN